MAKQPPSAPTASAIGPCPTIIQIVGRPGTRSLPRTIAPPDHPENLIVFLGTQERVRNSRGNKAISVRLTKGITVILDISVRATEGLLLLEISVFEPLKVYCYLRYQFSSH